MSTLLYRQENKKASDENQRLWVYGRRGGIRTRDPLHPMQVRYQAALHAEVCIISSNGSITAQKVTNFKKLLPNVDHGSGLKLAKTSSVGTV